MAEQMNGSGHSASAASRTSGVAELDEFDGPVTPEMQARVLAEHLEMIAKAFRAVDCMLADAQEVARVSNQLAQGQLRLPDVPALDERLAAFRQATSVPAQLALLRSIAKSMATLSDLARETLEAAHRGPLSRDGSFKR